MKPHYARRPRTGVMLAYPFEEKRLAKWRLPYLVQYKYNGHRCLGYRTTDHAWLESSTGLLINTVPHIQEALRSLPPGVYDGELYLHESFQKLSSLVSPNNPVEGHEAVNYVIFDQKNQYSQEARLLNLRSLLLPLGIILAPTWACSSMYEVEEILKGAMTQDYEGVVLREPHTYYIEKRTTTMMKIKPRYSDTYRIVGFEEEISIHQEPKGTLGAFQLEDADGRRFNAGSGLTAAHRRDYWRNREQLLGMYVLVKYPALTEKGIPWSAVFVEVVR